MKKVKRTLSMILALLMVLLVAACSNSGTDAATTDVNSNQPIKTQTPEKKETEAPTPVSEEPTHLSIMVCNGRNWVADMENHKIIMEKTNTDLDVEVYDGSTDTIQLRFSTGDLPDILYLGGLKYAEYVNTGYLLPLNDLLEQHGQNILKYASDYAMELCTIDGTIYGYPHENNSSKYFVSLRSDWLKAINFDLSSHKTVSDSDMHYITLSEFSDILRNFTYEDPDENGQDDTHGLGYYGASNENEWMGFFSAFSGFPGQAYEYDNGVMYYETSDDYRTALTYINRLWNEGVIDPEIFLDNKDQAWAKLMNGKSGAFVGWWSSAYQLIQAGQRDIDPDADWCAVYVTSDDGKVCGMKDNGRISGTISLTTQCEDPEAAMEFINWLKTDEGFYLARYGVEGVDYNMLDGYPIRTEVGTEKFNAYTLDTLYMISDTLDLINHCDSAPQTDELMKMRRAWVIHQFVDCPLYTSIFYGLPNTQEYMEKYVDVENYMKQMLMQFITGKTEINDKNWNEYISTWSSMGGSDILKSFVDSYNEMRGANLKPGL